MDKEIRHERLKDPRTLDELIINIDKHKSDVESIKGIYISEIDEEILNKLEKIDITTSKLKEIDISLNTLSNNIIKQNSEFNILNSYINKLSRSNNMLDLRVNTIMNYVNKQIVFLLIVIAIQTFIILEK